jgi:ABC-type branched-subunit amino acid transport system substrate-binding protein
MSYSVIFRITSGSFANGFKIVAYIRHNRQNVIRLEGSLPPKPEIQRLYDLAFPNYQEWATRSEWGAREIDDGDGIGQFRSECLDASQKLEEHFQSWMRSASLKANLGSVQDTIGKKIPSNSQPIFILEAPDLTDSENKILQRLPWHTWNWLEETFPNNAEVVLSRSARRIFSPNKWLRLPKKRLRILFILGAETGIDLKPDREAVEQHLKPVAGYLKVLEKPSLPQLRKEISQGHYNGIIFSGHSDIGSSSNVGVLKINDHETITIDEIENDIRQAQRDGLEFFVLNSCNGFGIASESTEFVDYIVLMREKIHNQVAAIFIKHCLRYLSEGFSLSSSVSKARTELKKEEDKYICASWMPTIVQNAEAPNYIPFPNRWNEFWNNLLISSVFQFFSRLPIWKKILPKLRKIPKWIRLLCCSVVALIVVFLPFLILNPDIPESIGERILFDKDIYPHNPNYIAEKQRIADSFKRGDLLDAKSRAEKLRADSHNFDEPDPELSWIINNAEIKLLEHPGIKEIITLPVISSKDDESRYYSTAQESPRGAVVAQWEINKNGTPKRKLGLILNVILDNNDANKAERVANFIVSKNPKPLAVDGHYESEASLHAATIYQKARIVMVSPASSATSLINTERDFIFRTVPTSDSMSQYLAEHIVNIDGKKKIAFCYDSTLTAAKDFKKAFVDQIKPLNLVFEDECMLSKEKRGKNVDAIVLYFHLNNTDQSETAKGLAKAANRKNISLYGNHALESPYVRHHFHSDFEGIKIVTPRLPPSQKNSFRDNFKVIYGEKYEPTWRDMMAYDAVKAIMYGLDQAKNLTSEELKQKLHDPEFVVADGSSGPINFNKYDGNRAVTSSIAQLICNQDKTKCQFELSKEEKSNHPNAPKPIR